MRIKRLILGVFLLILSAVALGAALLFSGAISGDSIKPYVVDTVHDRLGYNVSINGEIAYKIWPAPHVRVNDTVINKVTGNKDDFEAKVGQVDLYISLMDLLKGQFVVDSLKLNKPDLVLSDFMSWQTDEIKAMSSANKDKSTQVKEGSSFTLRSFEILDGAVKIGAGDARKDVRALNVKLAQNLLLGHYDVNLSAEHSGQAIKSQLKVNIQDVANKILGVDGSIALQDDRIKLGGAGILSWMDGVSYQGETRLDVKDFDVLAHITPDKKLAASTMLSVAQKDGGYDIKATKLQINGGQYRYRGSVEGALLKGDQLAGVDVKIQSDLDADVVLDSVVARILGNLSAASRIDVSRDAGLSVRADVDSVQHKFNIAFKRPAPDKAANIVIKSDRLNIGEIYKKRQVVAQENKPLFDVYLEKGQDYFHEMVLDYIRKLPVLPLSNWTIDLGNLTYQKNNLTNIKADFSFNKNGDIHVKTLSGLYKGRDALRLSGHIVDNDKQPSYDLQFGVTVKDPAGLYSYLPKEAADVTLNLSGDPVKYSWAGQTSVGSANVLKFKALHKAQLPKDHASLLIIDVDASNLQAFSNHQAFRQALQDAHLTGKANLQAQIGVLKDKSIELDYLKGKIGNTNLDTSGRAKFVAQKQEYSLTLKADNLHYTPRGANKSSSNTAKQAEWSRQEITWPVAANIKAAVDFDVKKLQIDNILMRDVVGQVQLSDKTLMVTGLNFNAYDGNVSGAGSYKLAENGRFDLNYKAANVNIGALIKAIDKKTNNNKPPFAEGVFSGEGVFASVGRSASSLIYGLNGSGKISGQDVTVNGVDLAKIGQVLRLDTKLENNLKAIDSLMSGAMNQGKTNFKTVNVPYKIAGGIVQLDDAKFTADGFELWSKGQILLTNKTLDIKNMITYKADGEEALPQVAFTVKGPFKAPVKDLASSIVEEFIRNKINRKLNKALNNVLQDLLPAQQAPQTSGGESTEGGDAAKDNAPAPTQQKTIDPAQLLLKQILGQ